MPPNYPTEESSEAGWIDTGTVLLSLAIVLVVAAAIGAILDTAGVGESQVEAAIEEDGEDVTDRLEVLGVAGTAGADDTVTEIGVLLLPTSGAPAIDLSETSVELSLAGDTADLQYVDGDDPEPGAEFVTWVDGNATETTIEDRSQRGVVAFELGGEIGPLPADEELQILITTPAGEEIPIDIVSPKSIEEGETVRFGEGADPRGSSP